MLSVVVKLPVSNTVLQFWDLGGSSSFTSLWDKYYGDAQAVLFFIDGTDEQRLKESWEVFESLKVQQDLQGIPIMVCVTKQDIQGALSASDIEARFIEFSNSTSTPSIPYSTLTERLEAAQLSDDAPDDKRNLVLNLITTDESSVKSVIDALFVRVQTSPRG